MSAVPVDLRSFGRRRVEKFAVALTCVIAVTVPLLAVAESGTFLRPLLALISVLVVPGVPVVVALRLPDAAAAACLAVALSLAALLLVSTGALIAGWWHPLGVQLVLSALALGTAALSRWPVLKRLPPLGRFPGMHRSTTR